MNTILSCHIDTVFRDAYAKVVDGWLIGACDNVASILAAAQIINRPGLYLEFTEDEELHMEGARAIAKKNNPENTFIIVQDVTIRGKSWNKINFTIENWFGIQDKHIRSALKGFNYKMILDGSESEAWLYKEMGFACLEIDVPVMGGLHSLDSKARIEDILMVGRALNQLIDYLSDKERSNLSDIYKVE